MPVANAQCFGGKNVRYELKSKELDCTTTFTVYYPPAAESGKVPVRLWRSLLSHLKASCVARQHSLDACKQSSMPMPLVRR